MERNGGCQCGAISYLAIGEPAHSAACWCDDCRAAAGATPVVWAMFEQSAVTISGTPRRYESSPGVYRDFCDTCGTGLFYYNEATFPGYVDVQGATFAGRDAMPAQVHIQVADAPGWRAGQDALPAFDRFPPIPNEAEPA